MDLGFDYLDLQLLYYGDVAHSVKEMALLVHKHPDTVSKRYAKLEKMEIVKQIRNFHDPREHTYVVENKDLKELIELMWDLLKTGLPMPLNTAAHQFQDKEFRRKIKQDVRQGKVEGLSLPDMPNTMNTIANQLVSPISHKTIQNRHSGDAMNLLLRGDLDYLIFPEPFVAKPFEIESEKLRKNFYPVIGIGTSVLYKIEIFPKEEKEGDNKFYFISGAIVERYVETELVKRGWQPNAVFDIKELMKIVKEECEKGNFIRVLIKPPHHKTIITQAKDVDEDLAESIKIEKMSYKKKEITDYVGFRNDVLLERPELVGFLECEAKRHYFRMSRDTAQSNNYKLRLVPNNIEQMISQFTGTKNTFQGRLKEAYRRLILKMSQGYI